jgi:5-methylcytosine-specific restriction endonuclease McrA
MGRGCGVPTGMVRRVMREGAYTCASCGIVGFERRFPKGGYGHYTALGGVFLSIDHIHPKSLGGTNGRANLRVLCTTCNRRKGIAHA